MKSKFILHCLTIGIFIVACGQQRSKLSSSQTEDTVLTDSALITIENNFSPDNKINLEKDINTFTYVFVNDTIIQESIIVFNKNKTISYKIVSQNTNNQQSDSITGIAKLNDGFETNEFEDGTVYAVDEYLQEHKNRWLSFRIESDTKQRMTITEADCKPNTYCPFESLGTMILK